MVNLHTIDQNKLDDLWPDCVHNIENVVDKITYETIVKNVHPVLKNSNTLELALQKPWQREYLVKFMGPITEIIKDKVNPDINLSIVIKTNGSNGVQKTEKSESKPSNGQQKKFSYPCAEQKHEKLDPTTFDTLELKLENKNKFLDPRYTFDNYVVGKSNHFAAAAAQAVAEAPARAYNPLFIYGGVGLGKTHMIHAIGHTVLTNNPSAKVVYVSAENFMNNMIESIQKKKMPEFRRKYRNVDVLLIDDIQFIKNKESTQEEFFHTFNELHAAKSQIVLTSDRPPKDIPALEDRLRSRFEWGLIADISAPDLETRMAILKKKADNDNIDVPNEVISYIAEMVPSNIRKLEGALNRVVCYSSLMKMPISMELTLQALKNILPNKRPKHLTIKFIQEKVCESHNIKLEEMLGKCRDSRLVLPRQIAMYLSKEMIGASYPNIGKSFGGRDHTTVMHACKKVNKKLKNPSFRNEIDNLKNMLKTNVE